MSKKMVGFKVDDAGFASLVAAAKDQGKTVSDYIRDKVIVSAKSEHTESKKEPSELLRKIDMTHANVDYLGGRVRQVEAILEGLAERLDRLTEAVKTMAESAGKGGDSGLRSVLYTLSQLDNKKLWNNLNREQQETLIGRR